MLLDKILGYLLIQVTSYIKLDTEYLPCETQKQESQKQIESKNWLLLSVKTILGLKN